MLELSESTAPSYLRQNHHASSAELLIQSLSGGVANIVLKVFDPGSGPQLGSDPNAHAGNCFVLKQPLGKFKTQAEWLVDIDRAKVERDSMILLADLLPKNSVPDVLWFDEQNYILAISCAPVGSVIWKKALMDGHASTDAAINAGMLLAMMHSATHNDPAVKARYSDHKFFIQQRIDPYFTHTANAHPQHAPLLKSLADRLLANQLCLIHGDFSPKNIFLVPDESTSDNALSQISNLKSEILPSRLLLLDFEVAFYGNPAFDVSTLINHFLLKGFYHGKNWRPFMLLADNFWQTYKTTAAPELVHATDAIAGHLLGALLLARIDGKSPAEYLLSLPDIQQKVRNAANAILSQKDPTLENALTLVAPHFEEF
jgi:5-methylthioribose kinase